MFLKGFNREEYELLLAKIRAKDIDDLEEKARALL